MVNFIRIFLLFIQSCFSQKNPPGQQKKQILKTCLSNDIHSVDPRNSGNNTTQAVLRSLFAGLTYLDKNLTPQLDLAKSCTISEDGKTYTFYLRDSKWSDGSAITAKDFEESWKSLLNQAHASGPSNPLDFIKNGEKAFLKNCSVDDIGIYAQNDKTFVVKLEKPNHKFLDIISYIKYYPVHATARSPEIKDKASVITSGPFVLKDYTIQNKITLAKNKYFWDAENILLEEIQFLIVKNQQTALFMFENKELDFFSEITTKIVPSAIPSLITKNQFQQVDAAGIMFLILNTQKPPLTNVNIRKALAYAIDRESIAKNLLYMDHSTPTLGIIPKNIKKNRWHPWFSDNDVQKAKIYFNKGLEELKITKKEFPPIIMIHPGASAYPGVMEAIQQMWQHSLGIHINCQGLESPVFHHHMRTKTFDIGRVCLLIDYNDPARFLDPFTSKIPDQTGQTGWISEKYNQEASAAIESETMDKKWKHIKNAEKIFCDEMPAIPLMDMTVSYVKHPYVKEVDVNPLFLLNFRRAYIE